MYMSKKYTYLFFFLILFCSQAAFAQEAEDLSKKCVYETSFKASSFKQQMTDANEKFKETSRAFKNGTSFTINWKKDVPVSFLFIQWLEPPEKYEISTFDFDGVLMTSEEHSGCYLYNEIIELAQGTGKVTVTAPESGMTVTTLKAYGEGEPPKEYHDFSPAPEKLDFLVVAMHPDDDTLFMGGVTATLCDKGLTGNILYMGTRVRLRCDEAMNGAWIMGIRCQPTLAGFPDIPNNYYDKWQSTFKEDDIALYLVRYFRQYKPEIVFSHDPEGEYGHWQHKRLSAAVQKAVKLCGDSSYDPESVSEYGTWEVKKCYLHLYEDNSISVPMTVPLDSFSGKTAMQIAAEAYAEHKSQHNGNHEVTNKGIYSLENFGLYYSTVGADEKKNDFLENIPPVLFVNYVPPTPEPTMEPIPAPTPSPSPTPVPAPTEPPVSTPIPEISIVVSDERETKRDLPAETAIPAAEEPKAGETEKDADNIIKILLYAGLALLVVLSAAAFAVLKKRK